MSEIDPEVVAELKSLFRRNGYVRWPIQERMEEEDSRSYRKGYEVRMVANSEDELSRIQDLLREAGFRVARPFRKGRQHRQPIYGYRQVSRFLALMNEDLE